MAGSEAVIYCSSDIVKNSLKMGIEKITTKYDTVGALNKDPEESGRLTEIEVDQVRRTPVRVECCFKSHKTYVYGCHCLANLYFTDVSQEGKPGRWELARTGVPVLILDKGETRARTRRMVHVVLAERGTGFALWKDVIDNLSSYQKSAVTFHTMHLSSDHRRMAGLSFDVPDAAQSSKSLKKKNRPSKPKPLPGKSEISLPCCFQHVTSVGSGDKERFYSLATLGPDCDID
ncbi:hypothetical protein HPB52_018223 [Rhipicephalus sanguineus]|uniref:Uncharacterized protein n=1 Tax=Rhipicephalus sanguineus TaxID=34632 RepID=A0A9D4PG34_RHISA|nr:hypothetical protein HPB52_018223 [Rhipicephalus sanguineus]